MELVDVARERVHHLLHRLRCPDLGGLRYPVAEEGDVMGFDRITVRPGQMGGQPCIRGLRIPVATVVDMVADGMTADEVVDVLPDLEPADVAEALHYAAAALQERLVPLLDPA